jgi:mRNA interferase YafQ
MFTLLKSLISESEIKRSFTQNSVYKKGYKKHKHNRKMIEALKSFLKSLKNSEEIDRRFNDHPLHGKLKDYRSAHLVGQSIVILYKIDGNIVNLLGLGSHSDIGTKK